MQSRVISPLGAGLVRGACFPPDAKPYSAVQPSKPLQNLIPVIGATPPKQPAVASPAASSPQVKVSSVGADTTKPAAAAKDSSAPASSPKVATADDKSAKKNIVRMRKHVRSEMGPEKSFDTSL